MEEIEVKFKFKVAEGLNYVLPMIPFTIEYKKKDMTIFVPVSVEVPKSELNLAIENIINIIEERTKINII
jgi:hypothetical protein